MFTIINKIMNSSLHSENSFIIDRSWQKINPNNDLKVSITKAKEFINLLIKEHQKLRTYNSLLPIDITPEHLSSKIHSFILKFIQQKQLGFLKKGEIPFVREAQYMFDLGDCLEIWRWINQDLTSSAIADNQAEEFMTSNEFTIGHGTEMTQSKRPDFSSKSKRLFKQLTLEQQENVLKKSLQMVHMYKNQLKIVFKHYCRFPIQNQHKRAITFDDFSLSLDVMTINRFMLFCRDFDIIKIVEFKRKTQQDSRINKNILLSIFRKTGHLQKYMNFQGFLLAIVHVSLKVHQNIDPRSYIHIQLILNALHVRYHHQFTAKLDELSIKYTPNDFYNCYKDILMKARQKNKKNHEKITLFNNPHFRASQPTASRYIQDHQPSELPNQVEDRVRSYQSVTHLGSSPIKLNTKTQTLQKRKSSLPVLPNINNNRFFKPIQHNHHKNTYQKYLKEVEDSSSVFKNRITGYSNINHLKHQKPFHMLQNPQTVSKETLNQLIQDNKHRIQAKMPYPNQQLQHQSTVSEAVIQSSLLYSKTTINNQLNPSSFSHRQQIATKATKAFAVELEPNDDKQRSKVIKELKQKVDLQDNDDLLKKHLDAEQQRVRSKEGRIQKQQIKG